MDELKPYSEVIDPVDLKIYIPPNPGAMFPYVITVSPLTITNYNQSISRIMNSLKEITTCSITLETYKTPVTCKDQIIYKNVAINKCVFEHYGASLITRVPVKIQHNQTDKTMELLIEDIKYCNIDFETNENTSRKEPNTIKIQRQVSRQGSITIKIIT